MSGLPGLAWQQVEICPSTPSPGLNCDNRDGSCQPIISQCVGQQPGFAFCDYASVTPTPTYKDVRKTCGPDLVSITSSPCSGVCDPNLGCQNPRCGDGKVEGTEECDDANTMALDGCEPVSAPSGAACAKSKILSVSAGAQHTCALFKGGYARCWGNNDSNQLGLGHAQPEGNYKPYQLTIFDSGGNPQPAGPIDFGALAVNSIAAGNDFTCAVASDHNVYCWGLNTSGQLGNGTTTTPVATPKALGPVALGGPAQAVTVGSNFACALLVDGTVRCWGANQGGRLGTGNTTVLNTSTPAAIAAANPGWVSLGKIATAISSGGNSTCALLSDGNVRCWGDNSSGQLGIDSSTQVSKTQVPSAYSILLLPSSKTATSIAVGSAFACVRLTDGTAECWGNNSGGQLGVGTTNIVGAFDSPAVAGIVQTPPNGVDSIITSQGSSTCAFYANGAGLHCWGDNSSGQLGYPDLTPNRGGTPQSIPANTSSVPLVDFGGGLTPVSISMGAAHTCAVLSDGELRCWGWNNKGQLGFGFSSSLPTDFVGGDSGHSPNNAAMTVQLFP